MCTPVIHMKFALLYLFIYFHVLRHPNFEP